VGHLARVREKLKAYRFSYGTPEDQLENLGLNWQKIKVDFTNIGWDCVHWINLAQNREKWRYKK
jgi:hypothetical protein